MRWISVLATAALLMTGLAGSANAQGKELNLFAWSEYVPQGVIDGFTRETGIKVNYETYASNEEMLSKLLAGGAQYDLIQPSEYVIEALIKAEKLRQLDHSQLTNLANLIPSYKNLQHDPGLKYSVPWMSGSVGIVVNTEKVKDDIKGFADVFSGKYAGRIVALDDAREFVTWAFATQQIDPNNVTDANLEKVRPILKAWLKQVKVFDSDSPKTHLLNGDVDVGVVWSGEAAILFQENPKFKYVLPTEGTHRFIDSLAIPKDAPNPEAALLFINYILRPEVSKLISDDFPYTNPNAKARELLTEEQRKNPASFPTDESKLGIFRDIGDTAQKIDKMVTDIKSEL